MMTELINRIPGFSDMDMYLWCKKLQEACESTIVHKKKTKDGIVETIDRMFETNEPVENRISNSVKFYLEKMQKGKIEFRDYQIDIMEKGVECLRRHRFLYLAMEVRTGKTLTSLGICDKVGVKRVLFVTKKKAISSIEQDYIMLGPGFEIDVINYESLHTIDNKWDVVILEIGRAHV